VEVKWDQVTMQIARFLETVTNVRIATKDI
jgi:hypothetical protein